MEDTTMQWHKIVFPEGEMPLGKPLEVSYQVQDIHQASGLPDGVAIFSEIGERGRSIFYFSPVASSICAELILSLGGIPCSLPANPMPSFNMAYGDYTEAWALVARDKPEKDQEQESDQHELSQTDGEIEERYIKIDPRDFIVSPFWYCPGCNQKEFGVLGIFGNRYMRRCRACMRTQHFSLPEITKKIIYLDQNAISNMMKALNPKIGAHQQAQAEPFWQTLFEKLDTLCKLQLIVCPTSTTHDNESRVSQFFDALRRMNEQISNGVSFRDPDTIRRFQVHQHLKNLIAGNPQAAPTFNVGSVVSGEINKWTDNIIVSAVIPWQPEWIDELRQYRDQLATEIEAIFKQWQTEKHKKFNDWFEEEAAGFGKAQLPQYVEYTKAVDDIFSGKRRIDPNINPLLPPAPVVLVQTILAQLSNAGIAKESIWPTTVAYLNSPSLREIPFIKISSMLWASIAKKAAHGGQKKMPSRGMSNDINTISTLLPYCDAMFVDKECWAYLNEEPLRTKIDFGTNLFSLNNKQAFLDYLDAIKENASAEHLAKIQEVYGETAPSPYTSMYQKEDI